MTKIWKDPSSEMIVIEGTRNLWEAKALEVNRVDQSIEIKLKGLGTRLFGVLPFQAVQGADGSGFPSAETTEAYLNSLLVQEPVVAGKDTFCVWAEENGSLGTVPTLEWAFGNGANAPLDQGVTMPFACNLVAMSASLRQGTATISARRNGTNVYELVTNPSRPQNSFSTTAPILYEAGDCLGFRTELSAGTSGPNMVAAWFERI